MGPVALEGKGVLLARMRRIQSDRVLRCCLRGGRDGERRLGGCRRFRRDRVFRFCIIDGLGTKHVCKSMLFARSRGHLADHISQLRMLDISRSPTEVTRGLAYLICRIAWPKLVGAKGLGAASGRPIGDTTGLLRTLLQI